MPVIVTARPTLPPGLVLLGLSALLWPVTPLVGAPLLLIGAGLASSYEGLSFDLTRRRYRYFTWILGWPAGRWQPLPATTRVVLKPHSDIVVYDAHRHGSAPRSSSVHIDSSGRYHHLTLLLSVPGSVIGEVLSEYPLRRRAQAVATGRRIAGLLGVPLLIMDGV